MKAADLIAEAKSRTDTLKMPSAAALAQLRELFRYNDGKQTLARVGSRSALEMLRTHGWIGGRESLDRVCRNLGRKSYTTP